MSCTKTPCICYIVTYVYTYVCMHMYTHVFPYVYLATAQVSAQEQVLEGFRVVFVVSSLGARNSCFSFLAAVRRLRVWVLSSMEGGKMASGGVRGDRAGAGVKEEDVLTTSQMSTQPHPFRSHTGVLERGIGREPLLSSASTQELEEALAARRIKSQAAKEKSEREQKKPRLLSGPEPGLPGFGTQSVRGVGAEDGVQRFDLTGDDDDLMGGEPAGPAPTIRDRDDALPHGEELRAPYASHVTGAESPPWVRSLFESIELMHHKQDSVSRSMASMSKDVDTAKTRLDNLEEVTHHHNVAQTSLRENCSPSSPGPLG